ncbi:RICIN domain-containing protein [Streptomyces morookaense]|uniref:RICIN domain-containing protein n=1 Tax=Streptomyces morookaense TaxID=1970 RepID=A0A7Y7E5L8_STRMO|nr:RICIN domain-containing protein [Streptomyces morookaense]NVK76364.1 RICIN domain-containing protein [Streptomyces morookaense]
MSRIVRAALATTACAAALAGTAVVPAHAADAAPSTVKLQAAASGKCLTIANGTFRNGGNVVQNTCADDLENQVFDLIPDGPATFRLRAQHSGKCVEVEDRDTKAGANVQQWWCVDAPQQRWRVMLTDVAQDLYELRPSHALDRCLDVKSSSREDGANVQSWGCNDTVAQRWRILPAKA